MKRILSTILCIVLMAGLFPVPVAAASWPDNISIQAEGGIVIDADTGTVLFGKNIHTPYYPASITKILTALIVIERCDLDEMVTFSHNAVYNVEKDSSNAGLDEGDVLSVRDCLYALLLKSANEAANALAEHVAGTTESFAELMNAKAFSLGCQDSHFANPSGLNDPNHYTSAYDMALIGKAALQNDTFMEIDSTLYYDLPVTKRNREGLRIYPGHKMIKKNMAEYYSGALGGKTGYTSLAGNTLVTFARRDNMTLVAVVLNGHATHYSDTKAMLNFGFQNFLTVSAADFDTSFTSVENDLTIGGLSPTGLSGLELDSSMKVTIPKDATFSSISSELSYDLTERDPAGSIAKVQYYWNDRKIGFTYVTVKSISPDQVMLPASVPSLAETKGQEESLSSEEASDEYHFRLAGEADSLPQNWTADSSGENNSAIQDPSVNSPEDSNPGNNPVGKNSDSQSSSVDPRSGSALPDPNSGSGNSLPANNLEPNENDSSSKGSHKTSTFHPSKWLAAIPTAVWLTAGGILILVSLAGGFIAFNMQQKKKEEEDLRNRRMKRLERLQQAGISSEDFDHLVQQRRSTPSQKHSLLHFGSGNRN